MKFSTREAAKKLGLSPTAMSRYIRLGKIPGPELVQTGGLIMHSWSNGEIERVRKLLPKIKNGRKTRYQKKKYAAKSKASKERRKKK